MARKNFTIIDLALTALFAALTAVGAFLRIPAPGLSFTLQLLFVLLSGLILGPLYGALSQLIYVLLGLIGLPIFTFGGGFSSVFQPSFGFLLGFLPAAAVTGAIAKGTQSIPRALIACLAGVLTAYLIGIPYMWLILNHYVHNDTTFGALIMAYVLPYLPADALKTALALLIFRPLLGVLDKISGGAYHN